MTKNLINYSRPKVLWSLRLLLIFSFLLVPQFTLAQKAFAGTVTASDDFNRADGGLGPDWTAISDGAMAISSQVVTGTAGATTGEIRTAETFASDQYSQVEVTSTQLTGGQWIGPAVRVQNGGQDAYLGIYFWNFGNPELVLYLRSAGSWTQLGSSYSSGPLAAGTQLELTAVGNTIAFLEDGVQRIAVSDSTLTGGAPGMMAFGYAEADNWSGGTAASYSVGGTVFGAFRDGGAAGQRRGRPERQRQRRVHVRFSRGRWRGLRGDGEDESFGAVLRGLQRLGHGGRRERRQRRGLLHE